MAKTKITDYTSLLTDLLAVGSKAKQEENFTAFLNLLRQKKELKKLPSILECYQQQLYAGEGVLPVIVYHRPKTQLSSKTKQSIDDFLKRRFAGKQFVFNYLPKENCNGIIIEVDNRQFDFSVNGQIKEFKKQLLTV